MKAKRTKKALMLSVLSLLLCCCMLIGSTFAWFTDSASSSANKIIAGNLDIELAVLADKEVPDSWENVTKEGLRDLFDVSLWEPGVVAYETFKAVNVGDLALKYELLLNSANANSLEGKTLADVLKVAVIKTVPATRNQAINQGQKVGWTTLDATVLAASGKLLPYGETEPKDGARGFTSYEETFTVVIYWEPTGRDNDYNVTNGKKTSDGEPLSIDFAVTLSATQVPYEKDSFNSNYDKDATLEESIPTTATATAEAGKPTVFEFPLNTPTGEEKTVVTFEEDALENGKAYTLTLETATVADSEPGTDGRAPVATVSLTLTLDGKEVTEFNGKSVTVTTYIDEALEDIVVRCGDETVTSGYDPETGRLTFTTTHFSAYEVYAKIAGGEAPGYTHSAVLQPGSGLNTAIKKITTGAESPTFRTNDTTVKSVIFCEYNNDAVGAAWDAGTAVDADLDGTIRMFLTEENTKVYICVQPDTQIVMNADSRYMFMNMFALTTIDFGGDLVSTSDVTNMFNLFYSCSALQTETFAQTANWDVSNVSNMSGMFRGCDLLTELDLSNWNTASLEDISNLFMGDTALVSVDLSGWDASRITQMGSLFANCYELTTVKGLPSWSRGQLATDMSSMFHTCKALTELDLTGFDTAGVTNMSAMFANCESLVTLKGLSGWDTESVTDMSRMFISCKALPSLDLTGFAASALTTTNQMFASCTALTAVEGLTTWDTSNVKDMSSMFSGCSVIANLDMSGWNTSKVTKIGSMFQNCYALTEVNVTGWEIKSGTAATFLFSGCSALERIYTDRNWGITGTSTYIFSNCQSLTGGNGTQWTKSNESKANYARIDTSDTKGYFTDISQKP